MLLHFLIYEASMLLQCTLLLLVVFFCISVVKKLRMNLPPGPWGIPLLGYLPFLGPKTYLALYDLSKKFGDIYSIALGQRVMIVLSDPMVIREAFYQSAFTGRPMTPLYGMFKGFGVLNTRGKMWKDERRFLHQKLIKLGMKKFGSGREQMEERIQNEVRYLLECVHEASGKPINMDQFLTAFSTNVITSFLLSTRYDAYDPIFLKHKEINGEGFKLFAKLDLVNYIWALKFLPKVQRDMKKLHANHSVSIEFYKNVIRERRKTYQPGDDKDVLDNYLAVEYERDEIIVNFDEQVAQVLCDLVTAGSESVKTTASWLLAYLLHYPEVVQKMRDEIDDHVSRDRLPNMSDQTKLIYCQAVINEVMRISNVVPIAPNHAAESDFNLHGYFIPKGSSVVALLYACHMSPKYWDNPEEFRPERFINQQGRLTSPQAFIPFGKGQRNCLGDIMAESEIFLFVTSLVQNFEFKNPPDSPLPSLEGVQGTTLGPKDYQMCLEPRSATAGSRDLWFRARQSGSSILMHG